mgnify:FL=1
MSKKNTPAERLYNGIVKENPTFVLTLGMCPTLAVTTSAVNGLGMGLTTMVVLALCNLIISALRKIIPAFIVIAASLVTMMQLLLQGFIPSLYDSLGIYIPLIVVNCIILGRAESYASRNPVLPSLFDGIGMGLGFSVALTCIGAVREILGAGELFGFRVMPQSYVPFSIFVMAPGAFFVLAFLTAAQNKIKINGEKKGKDIKVIDIHEVSVIADYFVIASASNERLLLALKDHIEDACDKERYYVKNIEGRKNCKWILMDYGDIVVHLFDPEERKNYGIEKLWSDKPFVQVEDIL